MYDVDRERSPWGKVVLFILGIILIIFIILFFIKECGNGKVEQPKDLEEALLKAGKEYYNEKGLPEAVGECTTTNVGKLIDLDYIKDETAFANCSADTGVKVCKVESGRYQYTPIMSCTEKVTEFSEWAEGTESDLVADKSDVTFTYKAERLTKTTSTDIETSKTVKKSYYPSQVSDPSKVKELYVTSPASGYAYRDTGVSASKWYTEKTIGGTLWSKGAYSATAPEGYPNKLNEKTVNSGVSTIRPEEKDGRTVTNTTLYRLGETAQMYRFECGSTEAAGTIFSYVVCSKRNTGDTFNKTVRIFYGCRTGESANDGTYDIVSTGDNSEAAIAAAKAKAAATTCPWIESSCTGATTCKSTAGYKFVDKEWQWSTAATVTRSYYPSGATSANGENTYYVSAPVKNAVRDKSTTTSAFKYYKLIDTVTNNEVEGNEVEEWVTVNEDFVSKEELIETLKSLNYQVNSLKDIEKNEELRYSVKLEYRSREN